MDIWIFKNTNVLVEIVIYIYQIGKLKFFKVSVINLSDEYGKFERETYSWVSTGQVFSNRIEITPQIHIRSFEEQMA